MRRMAWDKAGGDGPARMAKVKHIEVQNISMPSPSALRAARHVRAATACVATPRTCAL